MRDVSTKGLWIVLLGGLVGACGVAGLPGFTKEDRFHDVPSDPIIAEGKTDTGSGEAVEAEPMVQQEATCKDAAVSQQTTLAGLFNSFPTLSLKNDALVEVGTNNALVSITVDQTLKMACLVHTGFNNTVNIDVRESTDLIDIDAAGFATWRLTVNDGVTINKLRIKPPTSGIISLTIVGRGSYPCPDMPGVSCL